MTEFRDLIMQSRTKVVGLFDETILSPKSDWHGAADRVPSADENDWSSTVAKTTSALKLERESGSSSERKAQIDVTVAQLDLLSSMSPDERKAVLNGLNHNQAVFSEVNEDFERVHKSAMSGSINSLVDFQGRVIRSVDRLDVNAIAFEAKAIKTVLDSSSDPAVSKQLNRELEDKRWQMSAPFVERARLGSFLNKNGNVYQAEEALEQTVRQNIPVESMQSPVIRALRDDARRQLEQLRVENNLVTTYSTHLPTLDLDRDGKISLKELKNRAQTQDPNLNMFASFLEANYKYLDRRNSGAITNGDIVHFSDERKQKIKDFRFE